MSAERTTAELVEILCSGQVELQGRMPWSSNNTFLVTVSTGDGDDGVAAIYKPGAGERPLWDFPGGLFRREVAAYELSEHLGFGFVPPTVEVSDAPLGPGSLQAFVDADFEEHYFTLMEAGRHRDGLKRMAVFDLVANNADRKSGHCLVDKADQLWGIDHGLCFHIQHKLRTVIWDFAGEPAHPADIDAVRRLADGGLPDRLAALLAQDERRALLRRARRFAEEGMLPHPSSDHPYPWPLI